ncbi:MAG: efflux pump, inner rane subunit, partial [Acidobacteria bacterium]|nr:efflux pump, inner rane subunit [Acidobacteriota bacterium]
MLTDLRLAARSLVQSPGFALTALATLALGIGANTAVFGLVNQLLLNPPGIADPERVVALRAAYDKLGMSSISISGPDFADVRDRRDTFEAAAVTSGEALNYAGGGVTERLEGAAVSHRWFEVFGARPSLGRVFTPEEDRENASPVVVLTDATWKRLFGGDPGILGRSIELNKRPHRVVGVMPAGFAWPRGVEAWIPLQLPDAEFTPDYRFNEHLLGFARTRPGISAEAADAVVRVLADRVRRGTDEGATFARDAGWRMFAAPARTFIAGDTRVPLLVLLGAVGFVLLIACSNIAGLMLARNAARSRDVAIRAALGASRGQLLRRTMAESLLLACGGAAAGLGVAYWGMRTLLVLAPERAAIGLTPRIDLAVLAFTAAATIVSALLFGLAPAWQSGRSVLFGALKTSGRAAAGPGGQRLRSALVAAETALAVVLLVGAGLFLRSLARLQQVTPGFDPSGVLTATTVLPDAAYADPARRAEFFSRVAENLAAAPGVTAAAVGFTPGYFAALGIRLQAGRLFGDQDRSAGVAVIDENLARQYWPGENPLGKRLGRGGPTPSWSTVVGIVRHVKHSSLADEGTKGVIYYPFWQRPLPMGTIVARTTGDPALLAGPIRDAVRQVDPAQPVGRLRSMEMLVDSSLAASRFVTRLVTFFAAVALGLAALGLFGVISYTTARRTQEIGLRMALGADGGSVRGMVVRQGLRLAGLGAAAGLVASLVVGRLLASQLYEAPAVDVPTIAVTVAILL